LFLYQDFHIVCIVLFKRSKVIVGEVRLMDGLPFFVNKALLEALFIHVPIVSSAFELHDD
jgi:hypothetical protein